MKSMKKLLAVALVLVMLTALGATAFAAGSGSITVKNATKGFDYKAYKILDATYVTAGTETHVAYTTKTPDLFKGEGSIWTVSDVADANSNYSVQLVDGKSVDDISGWIKTNLSSFTAIDGTFDEEDSTVTFSNLDFGYYYITSGLGSIVTIDSAVPTAEVYDKNETTPVDPAKTIVAVDGTAVNALTADAHVGSKVDFKITAKTNNWIDKDNIREKWELTDTPTNMEIDPDSVVVKFNDTEVPGAATVGSDGKLVVSVDMVDSKGNSVFPANTLADEPGLIPIEITYSATITKDAGENPAKNQIPGSDIEIFTYAFQVAKTDGTDPLPGAQFELWSAAGGTTEAALYFTDNGDGTYTYDPAGSAGTGTKTLDMTTNTTISILGLDKAWSYTLKEVTVPEGYNQADDKTIAGSSLTKVEKDTDTSMTSTALYKETVVNKAGTELPDTGGIGTTLFYVIGSILFLGAAMVLVTKRRVRE